MSEEFRAVGTKHATLIILTLVYEKHQNLECANGNPKAGETCNQCPFRGSVFLGLSAFALWLRLKTPLLQMALPLVWQHGFRDGHCVWPITGASCPAKHGKAFQDKRLVLLKISFLPAGVWWPLRGMTKSILSSSRAPAVGILSLREGGSKNYSGGVELASSHRLRGSPTGGSPALSLGEE